MTNKLGVAPRARRLRTARVLGLALALAGLLGLQTPPASAAAIRAHHVRNQAHTTPSQALQNGLAGLQNLVNGWESQLGATRPARFLNGLSPTNHDGTLKNHALARLMMWDHRVATTPTLPAASNPQVASVASQHATAAAQAQAQQLAATISVPPKSSAFMVLIPPTSATGTTPRAPVVAPEVVPVPEPSGVASALALLALSGGWWRLRRVRPRAAS
jgi:hypothetical protein